MFHCVLMTPAVVTMPFNGCRKSIARFLFLFLFLCVCVFGMNHELNRTASCFSFPAPSGIVIIEASGFTVTNTWGCDLQVQRGESLSEFIFLYSYFSVLPEI